jgi:hypothetical protein
MIQANIIQLLITNIDQFLTAWNKSSLLQLLYEPQKIETSINNDSS